MGQAWSSALRRVAEARVPGLSQYLEKAFNFIPTELRIGPWAWAPTLVLAALGVIAARGARLAAESFKPMPEAKELRGARVAGFLFGASVLGYMFKRVGSWPMISWTMLGWTATTVRCLAGGVGWVALQRALTFPSLLANSVTVILWYLLIVPGMLAMTPKSKRRSVLKGLVFSLFLFIVHGFNWFFCFADWYVQPVRLDLFDLWVGLVYGLLYIAFYLSVLDPLGIHLYFILSPRKWWGGAIYLGVMALNLGIWGAFNDLESKINANVAARGATPGGDATSEWQRLLFPGGREKTYL